MPARTDPLVSGPLPSSTAHGLSWAGLVLITLFCTTVAGTLWPWHPLAPSWQLRVGGALINTSPLALTGLALLHLAAAQDPQAPWLRQRRQLASRLAVAASLGFLLLIPLLSTAVMRQQRDQSLGWDRRQRQAGLQLRELRRAVTSAPDAAELRRRLTVLRGPRLDGTAMGRPLPELRARLLALLDQAEMQLQQQREAAQARPTQGWTASAEMLRTAVSCLALMLGFASLARRPNARVSWLLELRFALERLRIDGAAPGRRNNTVQELVDRLAEADAPPSRPGSDAD